MKQKHHQVQILSNEFKDQKKTKTVWHSYKWHTIEINDSVLTFPFSSDGECKSLGRYVQSVRKWQILSKEENKRISSHFFLFYFIWLLGIVFEGSDVVLLSEYKWSWEESTLKLSSLMIQPVGDSSTETCNSISEITWNTLSVLFIGWIPFCKNVLLCDPFSLEVETNEILFLKIEIYSRL